MNAGRIKKSLLLILFLCASLATPSANAYQIEKQKAITPSIRYQKLTFPEIHNATGHAVFCNLKDSQTTAVPCIAGDRLAGVRETVESMARRNGAIAGVNVSYYGFWKTETPVGAILGQMVRDREMINSVDSLHLWHCGALGLNADGSLAIHEKLFYEAKMTLPGGQEFHELLVNPLEWSSRDWVLLYTEKVGLIPLPLEKTEGIRAQFVDPPNLLINQTVKLRVAEIGQNLKPAKGDCLIYAVGKARIALMKNTKVGDEITVRLQYPDRWKNVRHIIGGAPQILKNGEVAIQRKVMELENRTAMGIGKDGQLVILCNEKTTWYETAVMMKSLGVQDALMFDGGGSTSLVINGVNVFPEPRCVGDSLLIYDQKQDSKE